jgi:aminoglycoside phosphotransferase
MALLSPKVIAQVSGRSAGKLGEMSWEWIMRADGQVFYRLTEVNGRRERNPWTLATRLPAAELQAIRGGKTKATEVLDVIVRQHGHRAESGARGENRLPGASTVCIRLGFLGTPAARLGGGINPATIGGHPAIMAGVEEVEVVVAHNERATLRVGDVFLKIDADQTRTDVEVEAMAMAPVPTPEVLWRKPPVLALAALPGTALGRLGEPSTASPAAWAAAGAAARTLHDAPLPPWPGRSLDEIASELDGECEWLVTNGVLPADLVTRNRRVAEAALRPWTPVFTHGDLQVTHVFVDGDEITGVVDWSEAGQGDALHDLAILTLGHEEHLGDVVAGYGTDVDLDVIRAWWSLRSLQAARWLIEHGFDPSSPGCEFDVLRSRL